MGKTDCRETGSCSDVRGHVHFSSLTQSCPTLCDPMDCSMPGFPVHHKLLEFTQTHVHWVGDAIQPSYPLPSPSPAFNLSSINIFFNKSALRIKWLKRSSFNFSISPSNEYSGLISFRIDWSNLLVVRGTLKSLLQHHSLETSILQHSAFLMVQLSHDYWKNHCFDYMDLCQQSHSLLFNMLSRLATAFLPKSKHL